MDIASKPLPRHKHYVHKETVLYRFDEDEHRAEAPVVFGRDGSVSRALVCFCVCVCVCVRARAHGPDYTCVRAVCFFCDRCLAAVHFAVHRMVCRGWDAFALAV